MKRSYLAAIGSAVLTTAIAVYQFSHFGSVAPIQLDVKVFTKDGSQAKDAAVTLKVDSSTLSERTTKDGVATFLIAPSYIGKVGGIEITLGSQASLRTQLVVPTSSSMVSLTLEDRTTQPDPAPVAQPPESIERIYSSGPKLSGTKSNSSEWYELCGETPPGYAVAEVSLRLQGDRSCGSWAECQEFRKSVNVCMRFRLQGHNEWSGSGQSLSEGILTVRYRRTP